MRDPRDSPLRQRLLAGSDRSFTGPDSMRVAELDVRRSVLRESCRSGSSDPFRRGALHPDKLLDDALRLVFDPFLCPTGSLRHHGFITSSQDQFDPFIF